MVGSDSGLGYLLVNIPLHVFTYLRTYVLTYLHTYVLTYLPAYLLFHTNLLEKVWRQEWKTWNNPSL